MTRPELERSLVLGGGVSFIDCDLWNIQMITLELSWGQEGQVFLWEQGESNAG